jgi:hypothetical protein
MSDRQMPKGLWLRNFLVIIGAYYLASWLVVPVWIPIANLREGHVYQTSGEFVLMHLFDAIPRLVGAGLTGLMTGYFLQTHRPLAWAVGVGVFVMLLDWSATQWQIKPSFSDLVPHGIRALVVGAVAFAVCWIIENRRRTSRQAVRDTGGPS